MIVLPNPALSSRNAIAWCPVLRRPNLRPMPIQVFFAYALLAFPGVVQAAPACTTSRSPALAKILKFELPSDGVLPGGWSGGPRGTLFNGQGKTRAGTRVIRLERDRGSPSQFSYLTACVQMDFAGKTIELRGRLRTKDVKGFAGLWLREDGDRNVVAFKNMARRAVHGTTGWAEYSVALPEKKEGQRVAFGVLLDGTGTAWASGMRLVVDGNPVAQAPERKPANAALNTDRRFDDGSGIVIKKLDQTQVDNLVTLGKVWGFLKYYDPTITSGRRQWDDDLLRMLPTILAAPDRASANAAMVHWIDDLGPVASCSRCERLDQHDLQLRPDLDWIADTQLLGTALSHKLRWIHDHRPDGTQFYVALAPGAGNPVLKHERSYDDIHFPDAGFQLLALYRFWNIIEYWYPDRNVIGEDWNKVLATFIPKLALARDRTKYQLQLMALIASIHDTHANLWSSLAVRPPVGSCHLPMRVRFIQRQAVVTGSLDNVQNDASMPQVGDVITALDGKPVSALIKDWKPYYADSNEAARLRDMARFMTRGSCGAVVLTVRRNGRDLRLEPNRVPAAVGDFGFAYHDLPGPAFRLLSPQVAYLKLSSAKAGQAADYIKRAAETKGLIIDVRNYPSEFMVFALGSLLVERPTPFARFTAGDLANPGAFYWTPAQVLEPKDQHLPFALSTVGDMANVGAFHSTLPQMLEPKDLHYHGKIVILVDAVTQSQAEYTSMAFRAAPGALIVGSTTAGADGNVSRIPLPGGLFAMMSGIGVFYPDRRPTQRIGIVPDFAVEPTIADIRAGRDPVLERGLRLILGPKTPISKMERMYRGHRQEPPSR